MDAILQLALMTKASRVFAKEGQFLCFPALSPYSFKPQQLAFATKLATADDWRAYSEFSRAVNHVARGPIHDPADETFLWDIVDDVLQRGECAGRQRSFSPEEAAEHEAAMAILYADPAGDARMPSPAVELYGQYRDAILVAEEEYRNRELSAELGDDEALRARWRNVEAPSLRLQLQQLYVDWEAKGAKSAIESARQRVRLHAAAESAATWDAWRSSFNPDLDKPTDVLLNRFAGTGFTPADIAGTTDWPQLTLEHGEIVALASEADPELKRRLGGGGQAPDVERIVFECRSAGLDRSWLPKDLFSARFWRLPPGDEPLCNGADPPEGRVTAYAVGVVLARNVQVVRRPAAGNIGVHVLGFAAVDLLSLSVAQPVSIRAIEQAEFRAQASLANPALLRKVAGFEPDLIRDHRLPRGMEGRPVPITVQPAPLPSPEPALADPNITILALICRELGQTPNPDPSLPWPAQV